MVQVRTFAEAEKLLEGYMRASMELTGKDITLERMGPIMSALGNPEKQLKVIHIAGTSGKTSTTYYISSLLAASGMKVGTTVSPHIDSIAERVQVNLGPLDEPTFCNNLSEFLTILTGKTNIALSYFELLIAFAYWYFAKIGVDYAVVETGLGGMHDATNIAVNANKICVITDIGFDHMQILGNKLSQIAAQKAGIIHANNIAVTYQQSDEIMQSVQSRVGEKHAQLIVLQEKELRNLYATGGLDALPKFNMRNWLLARATYNLLQKRDGLVGLTSTGIKQSLETYIPARMDIVRVGNKTIVMDGAHNEQKMQAFLSSFTAKFPGKKPAVLLSLKTGKEYSTVLPMIKELADSVIITSFHIANDMYFTSMDLNELAAAAKESGIKNVLVEPDQDAAFKLLLQGNEDLVAITGSFYLIAQLRSNHKELRHA